MKLTAFIFVSPTVLTPSSHANPTQVVEPFLTLLLRRSTVLGSKVTVHFEVWPCPSCSVCDLQLWQWLVDLANERFFFGPMCMPVDFVKVFEQEMRRR